MNDAVFWLAERASTTKINSPVRLLAAALEGGYYRKSEGRATGTRYKPDRPGAKEARDKHELDRVQDNSKTWRKLLGELPPERREWLRQQILSDSRYASSRTIFEGLDPLADGSPAATQLAGLMWALHCRTGPRMLQTPAAPPLLAAAST